MNMNEKTNDAVWQMIEREKKKDLLVKKISRVAWGVTLGMLLILLTLWGVELSRTLGLYNSGAVPFANVMMIVFTMAKVLGIFAFIIAVLSTVGMFMRIRTTNLMEIQQRLTNLEQMILKEP